MQALARLPEVDLATNEPRQLDLLRKLWLQRLPSSVRAVLHNADKSPVDVLMKKADELNSAARGSHIPDTNATNTQTRDRRPGARAQFLPTRL